MKKTIKIKPPSTKKKLDIYSLAVITKNISLDIKNINNNLNKIILNKLTHEIEGKCIEEGYIKPKSINIINYSSGKIHGSTIIYQIVFECLVCYPIEGMIINCIAKNITKAGVRAEINDDYNPLTIFISRDYNNMNENFSKIQENDNINVRVIGSRYELNDKFISIIASIVE